MGSPTRLIVEAPIKQAPYNGVWHFLDDHSGPVQQQVRDILKPFRERGVPVTWTVHPTPSDGVAAALASEGLTLSEKISGMVADISRIGPFPQLEGAELFEASRDDSDAWVHLVSWRYGLGRDTPDYLREVYELGLSGHSRVWLARVGDEYVTKVVLHVDDGIYGVVTTEGGRGRGLASALTLAALNAAREEGVTTSVLHSTPMAKGL